MVVFISPTDVAKVKEREIDAGKCQKKIEAEGLKVKNYDLTYREETKRVWRLQPNGTEIVEKESIILVDEELPFTAEDIDENFSFGNGVTIGGVLLKDGRWIACCFAVFDHNDKSKVKGKKEELKKIFRGLK